MSGEPSTVNKPIEIANTIVHAVEYDFAVRALKIAARVKIPFLNNIIAGKIFDIIVDWFANSLYSEISKFIAFTIIDIQVSSEKSKYIATREAFRQAIASGNKDEIAKTKKEFETAFANGVHFDGV